MGSTKFIMPLLVFLISWGALATVPVSGASVPAIFVFGDSTADVGNNNFIEGTSFRANFPFYGIDFPGNVPTGRFSNGYNGIDFLAKMMGFEQSPPPVLSIKDPRVVLNGVSFASAGSGILETTGQNKSLSINKQLEYMQSTIDIISNAIGKDEAQMLLSKSMFIFSTGSNDLFAFSTLASSLNITQEQLMATLVDTFKGQVQKLYEMGARKFVFVGTTALGCVPSVRRLSPNGDCSEALNGLSRAFNKGVMDFLYDLHWTLSEMRYSVADAYKAVTQVLSNPLQFGYKDVQDACCGSGRLNAETSCLPNSTYCSARKEYLFWDRVHPTQATYRLVARKAFNGNPEFAWPVNVRQLTRDDYW